MPKNSAYNNVEFRYGDIEKMPVTADIADVVVSNCVLNLVPNKDGVFQEIYRVLKPGGHFSISDIVLVGVLPRKIRDAAEMYAGCVAGAIQKKEYLDPDRSHRFPRPSPFKKKSSSLSPTTYLAQYLSSEEIVAFKASGTGIYSVTVYAQKPKEAKTCCGPDCCS